MKNFSCLIFCLLAVALAKELPSSIPVCKRNEATINECLKKATVVVQPLLAKGIKELNVPPLEPLKIPMIKLEQGTGAVNYKATISNLKLYGLSDFKFEDMKVKFTGNSAEIEGKAYLPKIRLVSDYNINGKFLLFPIQGSGEFTANITNCLASFYSAQSIIKKKGVEYLQTKDTQLRLVIGDAMVHFDQLFNGDALLSKTTNDFFNDNAKDILNEVKPAIEAVASMLLDDILNKMYKSVPLEKLFPK